jgi:hypothetical protein
MYDALASPHCAKGVATATVSGLRVREKAVSGTILGTLRVDEQVTIWAVEADWALVQTAAGLTGWASMAYLRPVGELLA